MAWETADGTAEAGTDYTAGSGSLTFGAGETSKTVPVSVAGDNVDEPDETFTVTLSSAVGAPLAKAVATGTIEDDDLPVVTVAAAVATVTEGEEAEFELTRTGVLSEALEVSFTLEDESGVLASEEPATSVTFEADAATARVSLATEDDLVAEPDASVVLTLTNGDAYDLGESSEAEVTVQDDDGLQVVTVRTRAMSEQAPEAEAAAEASGHGRGRGGCGVRAEADGRRVVGVDGRSGGFGAGRRHGLGCAGRGTECDVRGGRVEVALRCGHRRRWHSRAGQRADGCGSAEWWFLRGRPARLRDGDG